MPTYPCSSSPFSHVLDTNYAPSEEEYANIRSLLRVPEQRAATLAQEIQRLQAELDEVQHFIDRHRSLLSPIRRVPADLLGEIFVQALPSNTLNLPVRTVKDAPLLLTTICHSWREVALKTPRLWNGIHIYLPRSPPELSDAHDQLSFLIQQRKQGVQTWLERSGALPITLSISVAPDWGARLVGSESPESDYHFADFAALLTKFSRRLGAVKISSEPPESGMPISPTIWQSFAELTREDLPILQDVRLAGQLFTYVNPDGLLTAPTPTPLALLLSKLSSLRTLHISEESVEAVLSLGLQWTFLTHLTLKSRHRNSTHASVVATIVKSCPSLLSLSLDTTLDHLSLEISDSTVVSTVPPQRTSIQSLTLRLQEEDRGLWADASQVLLVTFQGISTPALEDLTIVMESLITHDDPGSISNSYVGSHMPFHETLARSNCRITHLTINDFLLANLEALSRSFELLESLMSFTYEGNPYNGNSYIRNQTARDYLEPFLRLLAEDTSLCPHLERIQVDCEVHHIDHIIALIAPRHRLKHLTADFGLLPAKGNYEEVSSEQVKAAVAEWRRARGIQVVWKWRHESIESAGFTDRPCTGIPSAGPDDYSTLWIYTPPRRECL